MAAHAFLGRCQCPVWKMPSLQQEESGSGGSGESLAAPLGSVATSGWSPCRVSVPRISLNTRSHE